MSREPRAFLFRFVKSALLLGSVLVVLIAACWLERSSSPMPRPVVALDFVKFSSQGTNLVAVISFANRGQTEVCLWDSSQLWRLVAETPTGWITNRPPFATVAGLGLPPGSNRVFAVPMPPQTLQWRVTTTYGYAKRHHAPSEFSGWVWRSPLVQRGPGLFTDAISWGLDLLPDLPPLEEGEVSTPLQTNSPPLL
jgi:hypothetical protein